MYQKILVALENSRADETLVPHIAALARDIGIGDDARLLFDAIAIEGLVRRQCVAVARQWRAGEDQPAPLLVLPDMDHFMDEMRAKSSRCSANSPGASTSRDSARAGFLCAGVTRLLQSCWA